MRELEDINWELHKLQNNEVTDVEKEIIMKKEESMESYTVEGEAMDPSSLITTYANAKEGASSVGAHKISSEFFIKEMQYRKNIIAEMPLRVFIAARSLQLGTIV